MSLFRGFKNFLMRGDLVVIAVGLALALAFSTLIKAFTDAVITPLVNAAGGGKSVGLGVHVNGQLLNFGALISAIIYFVIFVAVVYFLIVVPYRTYQSRHGITVFGDPLPLKMCPECCSDDIPAEATRCKHCGIPLTAGAV